MDEERLERAILEWLSKDDNELETYRSFTTIYEQMARPYAFRNSYFDQAPEVDDKEYVRALLDQMVQDGLLEARMGERDYERSYRPTEQGIYERSFEDWPAVVGHSDGTRFSDGSGYATDALNDAPVRRRDIPNRVEPLRADSTSWTGRRLVLTDEAMIRDVKAKAHALRDKVYAIRFTSNSDSQDLKGLCDALVAVCEMAEPELSIIDRILSHPKFRYSAALIAAVATLRGALGI